jgi:hypothetical protein
MTTLEILRQTRFLRRQQLGRMVRLPPQSVERLECENYSLDRIGPDGRATLEMGLQWALHTNLTLPELLSEV